MHDLNIKKEIESSINNLDNSGELLKKLKKIYLEDKPRMREAELLYLTFYEGGTLTCKLQYYRHINRLLLKDKSM